VILSAFPHKDARYILSLLPCWALCAAAGFWRILEYAGRQVAGARCYLAVYLLAGVTLFEIDGWRFRRSESAVDVARYLSRQADVRDVAMEDGKTVTGADLYLAARANVVNIDPRELGDPGYLRASLRRPEAQYLVLSERSLALYGCRELLRTAGYLGVPASTTYGVFRQARAEPVSDAQGAGRRSSTQATRDLPVRMIGRADQRP
jgi:hypothetical protein